MSANLGGAAGGFPVIDPRQADAEYRPFPSFIEWAKYNVDTIRWNRYTIELAHLRNASPDQLKRAREVVELAAAVDTGAIEGLYETDRGFTFTVAVEAAIWQSVVEAQKGPIVRALIESQLRAFEYVLDFATQQVPIAEAWIRALHAEVCRNQDTYTAYTEIGIQELPLPKGEYKHLPNHILRQDGRIHSHAPVDLTAAEMHRLCDELRSESFLYAHPMLQASYAHYAFVAIHPFADGNGRVARALASVYTYRTHSIPLLILADSRREYFTSLEAADGGNFQSFIDFILERGLDAIRLFAESLRGATAPAIEEEQDKIKRLFVTKGGYSQAEVDEAGYQLLELFKQEANEQLEKIRMEGVISFNLQVDGGGQAPINNAYRVPTSGTRRLSIYLGTDAPALAQVGLFLNLEVPKDCGNDDDIVLRNIETNELFEARATELIPTPTTALRMRIKIAVRRMIGEAMRELSTNAAKQLRG